MEGGALGVGLVALLERGYFSQPSWPILGSRRHWEVFLLLLQLQIPAGEVQEKHSGSAWVRIPSAAGLMAASAAEVFCQRSLLLNSVFGHPPLSQSRLQFEK